MTAPDHRPYLLATDLRTAEDVARWLREHAEQWRRDAVADPSVGARSVRLDYAGLRALQGAHADLRARLDRERRQACRRGALSCWRRFCDEAGNIDWTAESLDVWGCRRRALGSLTRALAFRAAARQP
jgi:hypothetical protein